MTLTLAHYLTLGAILFAMSVVGVYLNRKNIIVLLMAIELMLLAINMNFVAFSHYLGDMHGQVFVFFILICGRRRVGDRTGHSGVVVPYANQHQCGRIEFAEGLTSAMSQTLSASMLLAVPLAPLAGSCSPAFWARRSVATASAARPRIPQPSLVCWWRLSCPR